MTSGKGGTFIGWISTGGLGFGSFHHGPVRNQLLSIRVVLPDGTLKELEARDPEMGKFLSTEGQMGVIVKAKIKVGKEPSQSFPFVIPFKKVGEAYAFAKKLASHSSLRPEDLVVYHSELIRVLKTQWDGATALGDEHLVLAVFSGEDQANQFKAYLSGE